MAFVRLDSPNDPRVADYRAVRDPGLARDSGLFVAEGRLVVSRLIEDQRYPIRSLLLSETAANGLGQTLNVLQPEVPVYIGSLDVLSGIAGLEIHRGCLALGIRPAPSDAAALLSETTHGTVVVLEHVGNPDNVGGVFRNAAAFGAAAVLLSPTCGDPLYRKAIRTSMAATLRVPFAELRPWPSSLERLSESGFRIVALMARERAQSGRPVVTLEEFVALSVGTSAPARVALLLGAEGDGLTPAVEALAEHLVRIPMVPHADSLNVSVAAGIALARLYEGRSTAG